MKLQKEPVTSGESRLFQQAYAFLNDELFFGALPDVYITSQRGSFRGYFARDRFRGRIDESVISELAMNPDEFLNRSDREVLSTLAHEMTHVWQNTCGHNPPRTGYHNQEWADKMRSIGLHPSSTGAPGGKQVGFRVQHFIVPNGAYDQAYKKLQETGFQLHWQSAPPTPEARKKLKIKFTCPMCGQSVWGKPTASVICGECYTEDHAIHFMKTEEQRRERPAPPPPQSNGHNEERPTPSFLLFFGLKLPTTIKALKAAYRRRARQAHPDHGGNADAFRELQRQYEAAMDYLQRQQ
jgi:hypothetical protein